MTPPVDPHRGAGAVFLIFLRLGMTSFGGPIAHLAYFRDEFVVRRHWLGDRDYTDLVALGQFLPGPASSQVGMAIGMLRAGYSGAFAAWCGFTLPSAVLMIFFAQAIASGGGDSFPAGGIHGLMLVALAVVAQAVFGMARQCCPDAGRIFLMASSASLSLLFPSGAGQVGILILAGIIGAVLGRQEHRSGVFPLLVPVGRRAGAVWLGVLAVMLVTLPVLSALTTSQPLSVFDAFFRVGALVFGGGHVVLPLLQAQFVSPGWISSEIFLAGYGAVQAVPGPLFSFAAFLGASMNQSFAGWAWGMMCLLAIFMPSFMLVAGALPFWAAFRGNQRLQQVLAGINAATVGLLLAAWFHLVWSGAIRDPWDFGLALFAFVALVFWNIPPWCVVLAGGATGCLLNFVL